LLKVGLVSLQTCDSFASLGNIRLVLGLELVECNLELLVLRFGLIGTIAGSGEELRESFGLRVQSLSGSL